jgi:hypothetical protein
MPRTTITNLPIQADGHNFWISSVDFFNNQITIGMPQIHVPFPTLTALTISNVTNIYSTYTDINTMSFADRQEVYPIFERVYALNISPVVIFGITTTAEYFSHWELQVDTANTFDVDPSLHNLPILFNSATGVYSHRPYTLHLTKDTTYYFRARYYDRVGNVASWSNIVSETAGDTTAPGEVGAGNVTLTTTGQMVIASVDGSYTEADDHAYYEWWTALTSTHPGGNGRHEDDREFGVANKSGNTIYFFVAAVDASGNRSANYTTNVGNSPYVSADYWTDISNVTDTSGDPILNVTNRGLEDENGNTVIDFTSGSGVTVYEAELTGAINFGTGGALHLTDNTVAFSVTPIVGMEIIGRGLKLYQDANNYIIMEKDGASSVNFEVVGGTIKTSGGTSYVEMDSTGIKGYNLSTQRFELNADGSGWLGGATDFYWDTSGNVTIAGTVTVTNIEATTGTIAAFTIAANSLTSTNIGLHSAGYTEGAEILLGHATLYASAKIGLKADGSGKLADGSFLWDAAGDVTMSGTFTSTATITGGTIQTATSGARVVMNSSGILGYDATTQRFNLDSDGSGWLGGATEFYWDSSGNVTIAGTVTVTNIAATTGTIAGWTIAANNISKTFDTDKTLNLSTTTNQESIYFSDPTPGTGDVSWLGIGTLYDDDTGWTVDTGIGMTVYNGASHDRYFWLSDTGSEIAGWEFTNELFRSAASAERIQLNATENRVSIFDAVNEKVAMGYLDGLPKNPVYGWVTSSTSTIVTDSEANYTVDELIGGTIEILEGLGVGQTRDVDDNTATTITVDPAWTTTPDDTSKYKVSDYGNWTTADYGFWAREGDHLAIDGDVRYDNGDWIIQHDASYLVEDSQNNVIIRLGTDTGEKGLFTYNASGTVLSKMVTDEIYIGTTGDYLQYTVAGGLVIEGDVTITNYPAQPFDEDALLIWPLDYFPIDQSNNSNDGDTSYGATVTFTLAGVGAGFCSLFSDGTSSSDYIRSTSALSLGARTITFWTKSGTTTANEVFDYGATTTGAFIFNYSSSKPALILGSSNYRYWDDTSEQDDSEWHFWCIEIAGASQSDIDNANLYVDTVLQTVDTTVSTGAAASWSNLRCGYDYNGQLQDYRLYNRVLTSSERTAIYTNPMSRATTRITGDKIKTGTLESNNWSSTLGSQFNLDDGTILMGGSSAPKFSWNGTTLSISGAISITTGNGIANLTDAGDLAVLDTIDDTYITNVDAYTTGQDEQSLATLNADTPSGTGFFLNATYLGFYTSSTWTNYMNVDGSGQFAAGDISWAANGDFRLGDQTNDSYVKWDESESELILGRDVKLEFATQTIPGTSLLYPDVRIWAEDASPAIYGYFTSGSNPLGGSDNNAIVTGINPFNHHALLWECTPTIGDTNDGGWGYNTFDIDKTKRYRFSCWFKRTGDDNGGTYFGAHPSATHSSNLTDSGADSGNSNPYFKANFDVSNHDMSGMVTNGDCELTTNWTNLGTPTTNERSTTQVKEGTYSRKITVNAVGEGCYSDTFTILEGQSYLFTIWLYGDGTDWSIFVADTADFHYAGGQQTITPPTSTWTQYTVYFTGAATQTAARVYVESVGSSGTLFFDDVRLGTDLLYYGDMEIDSGWPDYSTPVTNELSTTQVNNGTYSRKITVNAAGEGTRQVNIKLKKEKQYRATFWCYGDGVEDWNMLVYDTTASYFYKNSSGTPHIPVPAAWTKYVVDFVAQADTEAAYILVQSATGNTTGTIYIDDLSIQETPWYLAIGYIHPSGYKGTISWGGIYRYQDGFKYSVLTDFKSMSTATLQGFRFFFYNSENVDNNQYMYQPRVDIIDGNELSEAELLGNSLLSASNISGSTNISAYLISSPTIRAGDWSAGNYVQIDESGINAYGSEINTFKVNAATGSVTIKSSSGTSQRIEIDGVSNQLTFYDTSNDAVLTLKENAVSGFDGIDIRGGGIGISTSLGTEPTNLYPGYFSMNTNDQTAMYIKGTNATSVGAVDTWLAKYESSIGDNTDSGNYERVVLLADMSHTGTSSDTYLFALYGNCSGDTTLRAIGVVGSGFSTDTGIGIGGQFHSDDIGIRLSYGTFINEMASTDFVDLSADTDGYLNIVPSGDRMRLWESAEGSGDYAEFYADTSGLLNIRPNGTGSTGTGKLRLWDATGTAGDYFDIYTDASGNVKIDPGGLGTNNVSMSSAVGASMILVSYTNNTVETDESVIGGIRISNGSSTTGTQAGIHFNTDSAFAGIFGRRIGSNQQAIDFYTENTTRSVKMTLYHDGGLVVGSPTGGNKGAGTINATAVYDDDVLLTGADFVFEEGYNQLTIPEMKFFYETNKHLPTIVSRDEIEKNGRSSIGKMINQFWETIEIQAKYIAELEERVSGLET